MKTVRFDPWNPSVSVVRILDKLRGASEIVETGDSIVAVRHPGCGFGRDNKGWSVQVKPQMFSLLREEKLIAFHEKWQVSAYGHNVCELAWWDGRRKVVREASKKGISRWCVWELDDIVEHNVDQCAERIWKHLDAETASRPSTGEAVPTCSSNGEATQAWVDEPKPQGDVCQTGVDDEMLSTLFAMLDNLH